MKVTKTKLKQIIKEEMQRVLRESFTDEDLDERDEEGRIVKVLDDALRDMAANILDFETISPDADLGDIASDYILQYEEKLAPYVEDDIEAGGLSPEEDATEWMTRRLLDYLEQKAYNL